MESMKGKRVRIFKQPKRGKDMPLEGTIVEHDDDLLHLKDARIVNTLYDKVEVKEELGEVYIDFENDIMLKVINRKADGA